ncbi:hypothetical protein DITRI_Ditri10aG0081400 [Diplodiscus trichospermus]
MGPKQQQPNPDPLSEPKKKRRMLELSSTTALRFIGSVSRKEEVGTSYGVCFSPVNLNSFFEDGKIYGYQGLKKIFGETLLENKDDFLQTFSTENNSISSVVPNGEELQTQASNGHISHLNGDSEAASDLEIVRLVVGNMAAGHIYSRLVPLVLLVDAVYRFYHYPDGSCLRLSQIIILPPYQHKGYGSYLVEVLSNVAISGNVYDLTVGRASGLLPACAHQCCCKTTASF